jgi:D-aminoacyl-tRNA deacylase
VRAVVQRVSSASVDVAGERLGTIEQGLLILLGVGPQDGPNESKWLANKLAGLRIFPDEAGLMNRSVIDCGGQALVISQFTLYGNCRKGRRPSFVGAAHPDIAEPLYERFCEDLHQAGVGTVERGRFAADMAVSLVNDGPVTLIVDTP